MRSSVLLLALLVASCATPPAPPRSTADNEALAKMKVRFVFEDIPGSFWDHPSADNGTMFFDFFVIHDGEVFDAKTLKTIRVRNESGTSWDLEPTFYSGSVGGWFRCSDSTLSLDRGVLAIQKYTLDFVMTDGRVLKRPVDLSQLLSKYGSTSYVYSNTYSGRKDSTYLPALKRPEIQGITVAGGKVLVDFVVDDNRVREFDVFVNDKQNNAVGDLKTMVNGFSGQVAKGLNNGSAFYTNGQTNRLVIDTTTVDFYKGKSIADIDNIVINVSDVETQGHRGDFVEFHTNSERTKVR